MWGGALESDLNGGGGEREKDIHQLRRITHTHTHTQSVRYGAVRRRAGETRTRL